MPEEGTEIGNRWELNWKAVIKVMKLTRACIVETSDIGPLDK